MSTAKDGCREESAVILLWYLLNIVSAHCVNDSLGMFRWSHSVNTLALTASRSAATTKQRLLGSLHFVAVSRW